MAVSNEGNKSVIEAHAADARLWHHAMAQSKVLGWQDTEGLMSGHHRPGQCRSVPVAH